MIRYKEGIMMQLKERGYSSTRMRREKVFGEKTMQDFRKCAVIPYRSIDRLCELLECQPGDIIEYVPDGTAPEVSEGEGQAAGE